jgi:hypothetical protein
MRICKYCRTEWRSKSPECPVCRRGHTAYYEPSAEEISCSTAAIRATWTSTEERKRRAGPSYDSISVVLARVPTTGLVERRELSKDY